MSDQLAFTKPSVVVDTRRLTQRQRTLLMWLRFHSLTHFGVGKVPEAFIVKHSAKTGYSDPVSALERLEKRGLVTHYGSSVRAWQIVVVNEAVVSSS